MALAPRISRTVPTAATSLRPQLERSPSHLALVRACGCVVCGKPAEAHHLRSSQYGKAMARKSADRWTVPLCKRHHTGHKVDCAQYAPDDEQWLADRGIDARAVAAALWRNTGNQEAMQRVVDRARLAAMTKGHSHD